jgi:hypothetical protein
MAGKKSGHDETSEVAESPDRYDIWVSQTQIGDFGAERPGITVFAVESAGSGRPAAKGRWRFAGTRIVYKAGHSYACPDSRDDGGFPESRPGANRTQ